MKNILNKVAIFLSKNFADLFPKDFRQNFRRKIFVSQIFKLNNDIIIDYEIEPFVNVRVFSDYKAYLKVNNEQFRLKTTFSKRHIQVVVPLRFLERYKEGFIIELFSNNFRMNVKRQRTNSNILSRLIHNGKLIKISTTKVIRFVPIVENLTFMKDVLESENVYYSNESIEVVLTENHNKKINGVYAYYPHKFVELYDIEFSKTNTRINNLAQLTKGTFKLWFEIDSKLYLIKNPSNKDFYFDTPLYKFSMDMPNNVIEFKVSEHVIYLERLLLKQIDEETLKLEFKTFDNKIFDNAQLYIFNTLSEVNTEINSVDANTFILNMKELISLFSRKKFNIKYCEKIYQLDISNAEIINKNDTKYNSSGEILDIKFYRRRDNYLGFRIKRPNIKRLVNEVDGLKIRGFLKGKDSFPNLTSALILIERNSEEKVIIPIEEEFNVEINPVELLSIMSQDKTIIDFYVGFLHENEIIRQTKIQFKESTYKKDNYYSDSMIYDEKGNLVHFLVTTTPFNNLKIETFVVPKEVNTSNYYRNSNIWLIGERRDTAQENGISMFKYLLEYTDEQAYYVIEKESKDYEMIKHLPNVIEFGSLEHFKISLQAGVLLCTHDFENILPYKPAKGFYDYESTYKVFLQHGVLGRKPAEYHKFYYEDPFDTFIVSSNPEKKQIVMDIMEYDSKEVAVTGLARFDDLPFDNSTKDILLMPTWRDWINNDEAFLNSQYFYKYQSLLMNDRLNELLEKNNIKLNFYPHYRSQDFFNSETLKTGPNISFVELGERKVQDLLIEHSLLITDYSSVSFDFTLMNKPVIYYHFDEFKFFRKGMLRPIEETFLGDIADNEEQLVDFIQESIQNNFKNTVQDVEGILKYRDHNNRKRIYEEIKKKLKE